MGELLYETVSEDLILKIKTGKLGQDARLSERKLSEAYGVSRTVIRDALKVLNQKGYLTIRPGKGHYVKLPDETYFCENVGNIITESSIPMDQLVEARELIECSVTSLIIERVTDEDIEELTELHSQMARVLDDRETYGRLDAAFHVRLMRCCKNTMMIFFIQTLNDAINRNVILWERTIRENAQMEHGEMIKTLRTKDEGLLSKYIHQHIDCIKYHKY